jgi:hypothetical protein
MKKSLALYVTQVPELFSIRRGSGATIPSITTLSILIFDIRIRFSIMTLRTSIRKLYTQQNESQQNGTQLNDTQQKNTQKNDIQQNDIQQNDTQQNGTQQNDTH